MIWYLENTVILHDITTLLILIHYNDLGHQYPLKIRRHIMGTDSISDKRYHQKTIPVNLDQARNAIEMRWQTPHL